MTEELSIRPICAQDIDAVYQLEQSAHVEPWTLGILKDCLRVGYEFWVMQQAEKIIGFAIMSVAADEAHILNIVIDPAYQGKRLGSRLLEHMLALARIQKARTCFLEVRASNLAALKLYQSFNFQEIGRRKDYYPCTSGREDAIVLSLKFVTHG